MKKKSNIVQTTIGDAISDGCSVLEELGGEMENWYDSIPENLQNGDKASAVQECQEAMQEAGDAPNVPDSIAGFQATVYVSNKKRQSRSDRRNEAVAYLQAAADALREIAEDDKISESLRDEAGELADEVQQRIDSAESVEFPGMFG